MTLKLRYCSTAVLLYNRSRQRRNVNCHTSTNRRTRLLLVIHNRSGRRQRFSLDDLSARHRATRRAKGCSGLCVSWLVSAVYPIAVRNAVPPVMWFVPQVYNHRLKNALCHRKLSNLLSYRDRALDPHRSSGPTEAPDLAACQPMQIPRSLQGGKSPLSAF